MANDEYVTITERWTRDYGVRRIGDGPWELMWKKGDGPCPVIILKPYISFIEREEWVTPKEAKLLIEGNR